jgi:hypothetical protein
VAQNGDHLITHSNAICASFATYRNVILWSGSLLTTC